jgi:Tfp pilus assembly protein PilV
MKVMSPFSPQALKQRGITLVEVLIGVGIAALVGVFVGLTVTQFAEARNVILHDVKKAYLAEEGYELVRFLRDEDWTNLSSLTSHTKYGLDTSTTTISTSASPELIDGTYERSFELRPVYRNSSDTIVASTTSGATVDNNSKEVVIFVADTNGTTTMQALLMNFSAL